MVLKKLKYFLSRFKMWKLYSLTTLLVAFSSFAASHKSCEPEPKPEPERAPLRVFTNVVNSFKDSAILAGHKCHAYTWTTKDGCLFVTFEAEIAKNETARKI